jgi:hypothetical protein
MIVSNFNSYFHEASPSLRRASVFLAQEPGRTGSTQLYSSSSLGFYRLGL